MSRVPNLPPPQAVCWAINHFRLVEGNPLYWPAVRCSPEEIGAQPPPIVGDRLLVRYTGPAADSAKPYDCYWVNPSDVCEYRRASEHVLKAQWESLGSHTEDFKLAMTEAGRYDRVSADVEQERAALEDALSHVLNSIPLKPQTPFEIFTHRRLDELGIGGSLPPDLDTDAVQRLLIRGYEALDDSSLQALAQAGQQAFRTAISAAHSKIQEIGPVYLKLCEELDARPAAHLAPIVQLALFTSSKPAAHARVPLVPKRPGQENGAAGDSGGKHGRFDPSPGGGKCARMEDGMPCPARAPSLPPADVKVQVICNETVGTLYPATCKVIVQNKQMTATQFEQFAGAGSAKKWKVSLRLLPGQVRECPTGAPPLQVGKWLDMNGWITSAVRPTAFKTNGFKSLKGPSSAGRGQAGRAAASSSSQASGPTVDGSVHVHA